jgi:photosystem II stability/assembly factor-like uncharacterized protein
MKKTTASLVLLVALACGTTACSTGMASIPSASPAPTLLATLPLLAPPTSTPALSSATLPAMEPAAGLVAIHMSDPLRGWSWIATADGTFRLLRTSDGGRLWKDVSPKENAVGYPGSFFLDADVAWVPLSDPSTYTPSLIQTRDGGTTWKTVNSHLPFGHALLHFSDLSTGWAISADMGAGNAYYQVFNTHDGGTTWAPLSISAPNLEFDSRTDAVHLCNICGDAFYYDPQRVIAVYGDLGTVKSSGAVRLSVSADAGKSWRQLRLPMPSNRFQDGLVAPFPPVFFDGGNGVLPVRIQKFKGDGAMEYQVEAFYRTKDGGLSWQSALSVIENAVPSAPPEFLTPDDAFLQCGSNLCVTHDGAKSMQTPASSLSFSTDSADNYVSDFQFVDSKNGWAILTTGDGTTLFFTNDGGFNWVDLKPQLAH